MKNNKDTAHHSPKEILNELKALVLEAEGMVADSVTEHSAEAIGNLRARFGAAQERFSDMYDGAKKKVVAGAKYADESIRENPYQSLAIALGVGVLLGVIVGRRSGK
ncbi:MAG TPA: hypothetical protein VG838_17500 [Opitutaceae bacterium]|nr:hypothetical protein [Opitutaceae bacterium]